MCKSVLNDEWALNSTYFTEDDAIPTTQALSTVTTRSRKPETSAALVFPIQHHTNIRHNPYLDALHRSEEERHEYGFHIDAIGRTIAMLEPIFNKIMSLGTVEERIGFKVKGGFGVPIPGGSGHGNSGVGINGGQGVASQIANQGKPIHQRIVRKIYGIEEGVFFVLSSRVL